MAGRSKIDLGHSYFGAIVTTTLSSYSLLHPPPGHPSTMRVFGGGNSSYPMRVMWSYLPDWIITIVLWVSEQGLQSSQKRVEDRGHLEWSKVAFRQRSARRSCVSAIPSPSTPHPDSRAMGWPPRTRSTNTLAPVVGHVPLGRMGHALGDEGKRVRSCESLLLAPDTPPDDIGGNACHPSQLPRSVMVRRLSTTRCSRQCNPDENDANEAFPTGRSRSPLA